MIWSDQYLHIALYPSTDGIVLVGSHFIFAFYLYPGHYYDHLCGLLIAHDECHVVKISMVVCTLQIIQLHPLPSPISLSPYLACVGTDIVAVGQYSHSGSMIVIFYADI